MIHLKFRQRQNIRVSRLKDANGITNSVGPDQAAQGTAQSGSALFVPTCLTKNLGSLRYLLPFNIVIVYNFHI